VPSPDAKTVAVLYSGGTDSTASAALLAESFTRVDLLTYDRHGFHGAGNSARNFQRLARRFPDTEFRHQILETTPLARHITDHRRWRYALRYGFFTLQACGFCALVNHVATIAYCLKHGVTDAADGITYDWPFFPGHMDKVIGLFRGLHRHFGITYHTPVIGYDVDRPMRYIDKLSQFGSDRMPGEEENTTGKLLRSLGLSDTDNYKGTDLDRRSQARCYQFALPNLFIYWVYRGQERWEAYEATVVEYFGHLMDDSRALLEAYRDRGERADLFAFLE